MHSILIDDKHIWPNSEIGGWEKCECKAVKSSMHACLHQPQSYLPVSKRGRVLLSKRLPHVYHLILIKCYSVTFWSFYCTYWVLFCIWKFAYLDWGSCGVAALVEHCQELWSGVTLPSRHHLYNSKHLSNFKNNPNLFHDY